MTAAVTIPVRLDPSKLDEDGKKAESSLRAAINPTVDVFNVGAAAAKGLAVAIGAVWSASSALAQQTGGYQEFSKALEASGKALGSAADRSGALRSAFAAADEAAAKFTAFINSDEGRGAVNSFFSAITSGAAGAINALVGMYKASKDLFTFLSDSASDLAIRLRLSDGRAEALDAAPSTADRFVSGLEDFANGLTTASKDTVKDKGTFKDEKAGAAAAAARAAQIKEEEELGKFLASERERARQLLQKQGLDSLKAQEEQAQREALIQRNLTEIHQANADRRFEIAEKSLRDEQAAWNKKHNITHAATETISVQLGALNDVASAGWSAIGAGLVAATQGQDFGEAVANMFGPAIASLGATLVLTGTAALAANALATFFPAAAVALGIVPGLGVPAAIGAIVAGTGLLGGALAINMMAGGGGGGGAAPATGGGGGAAARPAGPRAANTPQGFQGGPSGGGSITTVNNFSFNGPMGGSPRRIARDLGDRVDSNRTLQPNGRGRGGR